MKTAKPSRLTSLATVLLIPLALGLFAVQLSAQTTTLYSTTFAGGTMDGWTIPISSDHNYMTEVPVGYAVTPDTHFGSSANIYSPSIDLTGYTSGYSINLSFGLADALSTNPALVIGIGGAPNPGNPFGWFINSPDTFSIVGDTGRSIVLAGTGTLNYQYFSFDITAPTNDFIHAGGDVSNFQIYLWNCGQTAPDLWTYPYIGNIALTASVIPEPSTYALLALGALALACVRLRKKTAR